MITWTNKYNIHKATIGKLIDLIVAYDSTNGGYSVSASGAHTFKLKENSESLEDGKKRAVDLGKRLLEQALKSIGPESETS